MTTEQSKQLQEIYDKFIIPSGMFTKELTGMDMSVELSNTIIDSTKYKTIHIITDLGHEALPITNNCYIVQLLDQTRIQQE